MKLYEFAVIKLEKTNNDGKVVDEAAVVVPITAVLARDDDQANLLAARAIPETAIESIDRLQVVVRPFEQADADVRLNPDAWRGNNLLHPPVLGDSTFYPTLTAGTTGGSTYTNLSEVLTGTSG